MPTFMVPAVACASAGDVSALTEPTAASVAAATPRRPKPRRERMGSSSDINDYPRACYWFGFSVLTNGGTNHAINVPRLKNGLTKRFSYLAKAQAAHRDATGLASGPDDDRYKRSPCPEIQQLSREQGPADCPLLRLTVTNLVLFGAPPKLG